MSDTRTYPVTLDKHTGRFIWVVSTWLLFLTFGAVTGFMTGLLAVGGGFIIVPLLRQFTPLPIHSCIATSLMIVALVGMGGIATSIMQGATLPMPFTLWFVLSAVTGMLIGRRLSHHLPEHIVQKGFAGLLSFRPRMISSFFFFTRHPHVRGWKNCNGFLGQNLWLNLGQGSLGFTLAAGSAVIIGALLSGENPAISLDGLA